jgi:Flp pilus assembly protein TadG
MGRVSRQLARQERGAAAVEFALIAPLLFMLIFGIFEFGRVWSQKNVYIGAAREGARYAAVNCGDTVSNGQAACTTATPWDEVKQRITDAAVGYPVSFTNFSVTPDAGCTQAGGEIKVGWTQNMQISIPFGPTVNLTVPIQAVFRCE